MLRVVLSNVIDNVTASRQKQTGLISITLPQLSRIHLSVNADEIINANVNTTIIILLSNVINSFVKVLLLKLDYPLPHPSPQYHFVHNHDHQLSHRLLLLE